MSMSELFGDLDPKIAGPLERITEALRAEISSQIEGVRRDVQSLVASDATAAARQPAAAAAAGGLDALEELKRAAAGIDRSTQQAAILTGLLEGAERFSSRVAFVLIRDDGQRCWGSLGFEDAGRQLQGATIEVPNGDSVWSRVSEGAGTCGLTAEDCAVFCSQFDASTPNMGALLPLSLGEHVAGYLYADRVGDEPLNITALQLLTFVAGQTLETLPVRKRSSTPALTVATAVAGPAPAVAEPAAATEPAEAVEPPAAVEEAATVEEPAAIEEATAVEESPAVRAAETTAATQPPHEIETMLVDIEPEPPEPQAAVPATPEPEAPEPEAPEPDGAADFYEVETPATDAAAPAEEAAAAPPEEAVAEESAVAGRTESPAEAATTEMPLPPVQETTASVAGEPAPAEPPAPAPTTDESSTQVVPPDDVLGPGWAFTTKDADDDAGNDALREEARRLARLLVTEIKLYNEEQVEQGRRSGDIYRRLQEDIDRSRQIFEDRIDESVRGDSDYFKDALVRILAAGDESLLGM